MENILGTIRIAKKYTWDVLRVELTASFVTGRLICGFSHVIRIMSAIPDMHEKELSMEIVSKQAFQSTRGI
jgi:hypothetical protein